MDIIADQFGTPLRLFSVLLWVLAFAWLATRLLGARRMSGSRIVAAGLVGYVAGIAATVAVVGPDPEDPAFVWAGFAFTVIATMVAVVGLELASPIRVAARIARPGIPHPIRAVRLRLATWRRFLAISAIATRHGIASLIGLRDGGPGDLRGNPALRVRAALEEAGGTFVKLGQLLSTRLDLVPPHVAAEFARLREQVPPEPIEAVRASIVRELGRPPEEVFAEFDPTPFAAASIAQVHRAKLQDGREVVVKVRRPGIAETIERDLRIVDRLARIAEARTSWASAYGVRRLARRFADDLREELDFTVEARNAEELADAVSHLDKVFVPTVHTGLSTRGVLVMDRLVGSSIGTAATLPGDAPALAEALLQAELEPMLEGRRFHADPHPGNVFVLDDGRLGLVDFGATGRLDAFERASVSDMLVALRQRDPSLLVAAVLEVSDVRWEVDRHQLERALAQWMARHVGPGSPPSAAMLNDLMALLLDSGVALPATTTAMFRALVTLEGTLELLDPGFPVIERAQHIAAGVLGRRFSPGSLSDLAGEELIRVGPILQRAPRHLDRIATLVERGELTTRVSLFSDRADSGFVSGLVDRLVVTVAGSALVLSGAVLLTADPGADPVGTALDILGYAALTVGAVLLLRAVLHTASRREG